MSHRPVPRTARVVLAALSLAALSLAVAAAMAHPASAAAQPAEAAARWVTLPGGAELSLAPMAYTDCPSGSACLWADANYAGLMIRLSSPGTSITNLGAYGFDNAMTSWATRSTTLDARWFYNTGLSGTTRCMNPGGSVSNVGTTDNDQASSFALYTNASACT